VDVDADVGLEVEVTAGGTDWDWPGLGWGGAGEGEWMRTGIEILLTEEDTGTRRVCTSSMSTSETMTVGGRMPWEHIPSLTRYLISQRFREGRWLVSLIYLHIKGGNIHAC